MFRVLAARRLFSRLSPAPQVLLPSSEFRGQRTVGGVLESDEISMLESSLRVRPPPRGRSELYLGLFGR